MARKARSDSVLLTMPHHQQDALASWLMDEGISYAAAVERLHMDFGVKTSEAALGNFWLRVCSPRQFARVAEAADALPEAAGGLAANWEESSIALVRQRYFQLLASNAADPKEVAIFAAQIADISRGQLERQKLRTKRQEIALRTRLKRADQRLSERRVKLLEKKAAEATAAVNDSKLTDAQKAQRVREIFQRE